MRDKADFTEGDVALSLAKGSTFFLGLPKKILAKKKQQLKPGVVSPLFPFVLGHL